MRQEFEKGALEFEHVLSINNSELFVLKNSQLEMTKKLENQIEINNALEKQLRNIKWELSDSNRMTSARIIELEDVIKKGDLMAENESKSYMNIIQELEQNIISRDKVCIFILM
jgi:DNA gyrase/topoisomerase IV subunit A